MNNIKFLQEKKSSLLHTREYAGYGQKLKIVFDGIDTTIIVKPEDVFSGVKITGLEFNRPWLTIDSVPVSDTEKLIKNLNNAKAFCEEFIRRKEGFLDFS